MSLIIRWTIHWSHVCSKRYQTGRQDFFKQNTPYILPRLYSVCAYIVHLYTAAHTCIQHAHACAAKQSELVRRCIATTALFALSGTSCCRVDLRLRLARLGRACLFQCFSQVGTKSYVNTSRLHTWSYELPGKG